MTPSLLIVMVNSQTRTSEITYGLVGWEWDRGGNTSISLIPSWQGIDRDSSLYVNKIKKKKKKNWAGFQFLILINLKILSICLSSIYILNVESFKLNWFAWMIELLEL